jgi:hypothetical protein
MEGSAWKERWRRRRMHGSRRLTDGKAPSARTETAVYRAEIWERKDLDGPRGPFE